MDEKLSRPFDCTIVGGGLVGATLAIALGRRGLRTALIEAHPPNAQDPPSYDDRTLALSHASCRILRALGVWPESADAATPIREVHVSARGRFGTARITAAELGVETLGHVVEARLLGRAITTALPACDAVVFLNPAGVGAFEDDGASVRVALEGEGLAGTALRTAVLLGADGARSSIRKQLGLATMERDYGQTAVIANVTPERPHGGRAFERFTDTGPVAILPHQGTRCGAVWVTRSEDAQALLAEDDPGFLAGLQARVGHRLGRFRRVGRRAAYPLRLRYAPQAVRGRCAVLGNAAHAIHPVAAQGFNLGLRDVVTLVDVLADRFANGGDPAEALLAYQDSREPDQRRMVGFTDFLVDAFAVDLPLLRHLPALGILAVDRLPGLKRALAHRTMGYGRPLPQLAPPR